MGEAGYERDATDDEIRGMQQVIADALAAGAAGFATVVVTDAQRRPRPARCRRASPTSPSSARCSQPLRDARQRRRRAAAGREGHARRRVRPPARVGRPLTWTALLTVKGFPWHEKIMAANTAARAEGIEVWPQVSCRPLTFQMNLREPFTFNMRPAFQELMDRPSTSAWPRTAIPRGATGPGTRCRAGRERGCPLNFDSLAVAESDTHPELVGRQVVDIAAGTRRDAARRHARPLARGEPRDAVPRACSPTTIPTRSRGCSRRTRCCSGSPTRARTSASCATRASPPTCSATGCATRTSCRSSTRSTSSRASPPACSDLRDRGTLEVGKAADVVVFDADTIAPGPLRRIRDFPADGERLVADKPVGMRHVLVNGTVIREDEQPITEALEQRPGKLLRS